MPGSNKVLCRDQSKTGRGVDTRVPHATDPFKRCHLSARSDPMIVWTPTGGGCTGEGKTLHDRRKRRRTNDSSTILSTVDRDACNPSRCPLAKSGREKATATTRAFGRRHLHSRIRASSLNRIYFCNLTLAGPIRAGIANRDSGKDLRLGSFQAV